MWPRAWRFDPPHLLSAQVELIDRGLTTALVASALVAIIAAVGYQLTVGDARIWWWSAGTVGLAWLGLIAHRLVPAPGQQNFDPVRHGRFLVGLAAASGACWGALALLFLRSGEPDSGTLILCLIAGMGSAALGIFGSVWPVALAYWLCCLVPLIIALLRAEGTINWALAAGATAYLWAMSVYSYHASRMTLRSVELRFENEGLVARLRDQTERALEAREMVERALVEAEDANRAKTVFLASASHDLRQPLHAAGLYLGALSRAGLNDRQAHLVRHVMTSNEAANEMLSTLLDFSKVDAGVVQPQQRTFALQPLFHKLERELAPLAESKGLVFRLRDTRMVVQADPALVEMIVRNLLVNAVRYTERGGVLLGCRQRGARAVVEVWDTGIGIPQAQHREIFREFHQLGNPERDRRKGLGLGLSIVDGLARAMGVEVGLASREGRGSVFRVNLPISQAAVIAAERAAEPGGDLSGLHVLLIEDDESVLAAMSDLLINWGCACETAASVDEAVARLDAFTPHLLLVDYRLRDHRSGIEAVSLIRERLGPELPAILVTGDTGPQRLREAHASGLILLHKPVPAERLHGALLSQWRRGQVASAERASAAG
jgi:signal transduction histidine kinase/ActR/RegA family two-component response regulator